MLRVNDCAYRRRDNNQGLPRRWGPRHRRLPLAHHRRTMVRNKQESGRKYWTTRLAIRFFAHTSHLFASSALLASHYSARTATLHSFFHPRVCEKVHDSMSQNDLGLSHSAPSSSSGGVPSRVVTPLPRVVVMDPSPSPSTSSSRVVVVDPSPSSSTSATDASGSSLSYPSEDFPILPDLLTQISHLRYDGRGQIDVVSGKNVAKR